MKNKCWIVGLFICLCHISYGQKDINSLFREFRYENNVTKITLKKGVMAFASLFTNTMGINNIEVLSFDQCDHRVKDRLSEAIKKVNDPDYETVISSNENGKRTKVLIKIKEDTIREMVIITSGDDMALVRLKGEIKTSDIEKLVKEHGNG